MKDSSQNRIANHASPGDASSTGEATLRLIAKLPAPEGLADRVYGGLLEPSRTARRGGRVLSWPVRANNSWMRGAAAAAIAFVVAGGGWGVYTQVQKPQSAKVIVLPHGSAPGGFSNAGAMRTPNTLNGPLLAHPKTAKPKVPAKATARKAPLHGAQPAATSKEAAQPAATSKEAAQPAAALDR